MVLEYTQAMVNIAKEQNVNEETHIHPPTFKLLQDLVNHILPSDEVQFFSKKLTGTVEIGYQTNLCTNWGVLQMTGETDLLLCFGGVPVANIEVKNLNMPCNTPSEIGEILAEDKGFAERHKQCVGVEPRLFPSLLVSGRRWVFVDRAFVNGGEMYLQFPALMTFNIQTVPVAGEEGEGPVYEIDESSVEMVNRMLMRMMHAIRKLIKAMRATMLRVYDVYAESKKDTQGGGESPYANGKLTSSAAANRGAKRGRGGGGGDKKKRATQSNLTMVNMYRHDLNTLWDRIEPM